MSNQVCLLCLHVIDDTAAKSAQKLRIKTLFQLITLCHQNYKLSQHEFDEDEMCNFCADCYPLFSQMEEIRRQISLLEEEIGSKVREIQATILHTSSSHLGNDGEEKILQIRDMLLRVAGASSEDFDEGEVQVKVEEEDEGTMMALTLSAM